MVSAPPARDPLALPDQAAALWRDGAAWLREDSLSALIGVGIAVLLYLLLVAAREVAKRWLATDAGGWRGIAGELVARTRSYFLAAASAQAVTRAIVPPDAWGAGVAFIFTVAAALQGAVWLRALILGVVERRAEASDDGAGFASAVGVIRVLVTVGVWALVAVLLLGNLGVDVTALVAGLGIGGIAIALAAQGIFADLFAALAILLDRPFRRGDAIGIDGLDGDVEAIGLKTTRIRALSGEVVVVSNTKLLDQRIRNYRQVEARRVTLAIGVMHGTPVELLERLPAEAEVLVGGVEHCRFGWMVLTRIGESSLDFELVFHVDQPDYATMLAARHAVLMGLVRRLGELGVELARPARVVSFPPPLAAEVAA